MGLGLMCGRILADRGKFAGFQPRARVAWRDQNWSAARRLGG